MSNSYLEFNDIIKNFKKYCEEIEIFIKMDEEQKKRIFSDEVKNLEKLLNFFFLSKKTSGFVDDLNLKFNMSGLFLERFVKFFCMREDYKRFWDNYYIKEGKCERVPQNYSYYKKEFFKFIEKKEILEQKQLERLKDVLKYYNFQRNNFVHGHLKACDFGDIDMELLIFILTILKIYKLEFSEENVL